MEDYAIELLPFIDGIIISSLPKHQKTYQLTNEMQLDLTDCGLLRLETPLQSSLPDIIALGDFPRNTTKEITLNNNTTVMHFDSFNTSSIMQKRLLEYWWQQFKPQELADNQIILFGWTKGENYFAQYDCLGLNVHPKLWIIPLKIP